MSCLRKRLKRSEEEERAFQEHAKKVAQENGKRLGKTPPYEFTRLAIRILLSKRRASVRKHRVCGRKKVVFKGT